MSGYCSFKSLNLIREMTGFLKKLPQFPIFLGLGNLEDLISITACAILCMLGIFPSSFSDNPLYEKFNACGGLFRLN